MIPLISGVMVALKLSSLGKSEWTVIAIVFLLELVLVYGLPYARAKWSGRPER